MLTTVKVVALNNNNCNKKVGLKSTMLNWLGDCFLIASKFQLFNFCGLRIQIFSLGDVEARKRVSHVIE